MTGNFDLPRLQLAGVRPGARVVAALSGGVDSAVAAALVVRAGYEVIGITLQLYDHGAALGRKGACCAGQDIYDARRIADTLAIPHYVLDFEERFRRAVIEDFADNYARGRTPVPCVRCNERIKFRDLLQVARDFGAEALVTGHYVRRVEGPEGPQLHRARDAAKDQSWFLFAIPPAALPFCHFPLGELYKAETRAIAEALALPVARKPESQDICFVPDGDHARLVGRLRPEALQPGNLEHIDGRQLGGHPGIAHFTVGQRRGLRVATGERLYVLEIDAARHRVLVGPRAATLCQRLRTGPVNWLVSKPPAAGQTLWVQHRYNQPAVPASVVSLAADGAWVHFAAPESGVAPGQACVFYDGDQLLGGGWIEAAPRLAAAGEALSPAC